MRRKLFIITLSVMLLASLAAVFYNREPEYQGPPHLPCHQQRIPQAMPDDIHDLHTTRYP